MPMIQKGLGDVVPEDLLEIVRHQWVEDEQLDFKSTVPHKDGKGRDPWRDASDADGRRIKDHGRDQILAAVVAFANSYGGDLIIGIRECPNSQPGKAEAIDPLPAFEDAAHRLSQMANECIEPPIIGLEVRGLALREGDAGVVIFRAPRSRNAPHRLTTTRECYHRVRHETKPMTMRQIQDLTFNVARGLGEVERRLTELGQAFRTWSGMHSVPDGVMRGAVRATCVPTDRSVYAERVHGVEQIRPLQRNLRVRARAAGGLIQLNFPFNVHDWRPVLRGTIAADVQDDSRQRIGVYCDGSICYEYAFDARSAPKNPSSEMPGYTYRLLLDGLFPVYVNAVESAHRFRAHAGGPAVEYAMEIEIFASAPLPVMPLGGAYPRAAGMLPAGVNSYPRYSVGAPESWPGLYALMWRDFWNSIGIDASADTFSVDPT